MDRLNPGKQLVAEFRLKFKEELNKIGLVELLDSSSQENVSPFCENECEITDIAEETKRPFIERCKESSDKQLLPQLKAGMEIVVSSVLEENQKNQTNATQTVNTIVQMLTAMYESDFHNFLRPFSIDNSTPLSESVLQYFHDQKMQELLVRFDGNVKPGNEIFQQRFRMHLSNSFDKIFKKILHVHKNQPSPTNRKLRKFFFGCAVITLGAVLVGVTLKALRKETSLETQLVVSLSKEVEKLKLMAIQQEELVADLIQSFYTLK